MAVLIWRADVVVLGSPAGGGRGTARSRSCGLEVRAERGGRERNGEPIDGGIERTGFRTLPGELC